MMAELILSFIAGMLTVIALIFVIGYRVIREVSRAAKLHKAVKGAGDSKPQPPEIKTN
jgi:hypothetical protein